MNTRHETLGRGAGHGNPRSHRWLIFAAIVLLASPAFAQIPPGQLVSDSPVNAASAANPSANPGPVATQIANNYQPMTGAQRFRWFAGFTLDPEALAGEAFDAGVGTWEDRPHEYGRSWAGFGKRFGMGLSGDVVSNGMEAGLGAIWGEDPRYFREGNENAVT